MSINTIIEGQKKSLLNLILEEYDLDSEQVWYWHTQSIKQLLEAEVERLKGERYNDNSLEDSDNKEDIWYKKGYNQSLDDQITHLTNIIKEICLEKQ